MPPYTRPWATPNSCWSPPRMRQPKAYHRSTAVDYADYYANGQSQPTTYAGDTRGYRGHGFSYSHNGYYDYDDYYAYRQPQATYVPLPRVRQPPDPGIRKELDSIRVEFRSILRSFKSLVQNLQAEQSNRASDPSAPELMTDMDVGDVSTVSDDDELVNADTSKETNSPAHINLDDALVWKQAAEE